ncbi:hypothetical protein AVEN_179531-1 [Araneus ventricosus]|uniref:Uncharacterized protein n=1 Tax=Araneus ventricosus TaxID=182803 RepID=A0A4Y2K9A8_ARAVE|nr:hypothetical protein AVEN_101752-1 [Araneus ventricosus]GBM97966.1 hypothetical protein AVEN_179531-1 [Araneus ventricosus]
MPYVWCNWVSNLGPSSFEAETLPQAHDGPMYKPLYQIGRLDTHGGFPVDSDFNSRPSAKAKIPPSDHILIKEKSIANCVLSYRHEKNPEQGCLK